MLEADLHWGIGHGLAGVRRVKTSSALRAMITALMTPIMSNTGFLATFEDDKKSEPLASRKCELALPIADSSLLVSQDRIGLYFWAWVLHVK